MPEIVDMSGCGDLSGREGLPAIATGTLRSAPGLARRHLRRYLGLAEAKRLLEEMPDKQVMMRKKGRLPMSTRRRPS